ncbi:transcription factor IBH1-like 1 [Corylus avellana]|uniref:transcription factor IBH1-like 1 n=1 Tax=Corylus avellana TaxID=13451 RepID=UPI00286D09F7|nr:transcription factor IBH1-like 1 [Corylus avellana]
MRSSSSLKQEFLKKWIMGLQRCTSSNKNMSILERKKAIKLSADLAMAAARNGRTSWSRAVIANAARESDKRLLAEKILQGQESEMLLKKVSNMSAVIRNRRIIRSKKILKRSRRRTTSEPQKVLASSIAKRLVQKRTHILKSLVPGGEFMDEISLIEETLDYIAYLRAQVDVMRCIATSPHLMALNSE